MVSVASLLFPPLHASFQVKINKYASLEKKFLSCLDIYAFPEQLACFCPVETELCN